MKLRQIKKVDMVDAWTQTSERGSDTEKSKSSSKKSSNHLEKQHHPQQDFRIKKDPFKSSSQMQNLIKFEEKLAGSTSEQDAKSPDGRDATKTLNERTFSSSNLTMDMVALQSNRRGNSRKAYLLEEEGPS